MSPQITDTKTAALEELYSRITRVAGAMGGTASLHTSSLSVPSAMVAEPQTEDAPALRVNMPKSFQVDFAPFNPLSVGTALCVKATRTTGMGRKDDWSFIHGPNGWQRSNSPLSDHEIRECLTPEGPPASS